MATNKPLTPHDRERHSLIAGMEKALADSDDIFQMPENIFVTYFLGLFRGDIPVDESTVDAKNELLEHWLKLSGGPLRPIRVVDAQGTLLFEVPALSTTSMFNTQRKEGATTFSEIAKLAHHYSLITPVAEENYTSEALEKKFADIYTKNHQLSEREKTWVSIFERYKTSYPGPDQTTAPVAGHSTKPFDDKFSDDEMIF